MDEIRIHGLVLDCIVGIHAHERLVEQPLRVDLTLTLDTRDAARSGRISRTIHYGDVAEQVRAMLRFRRYRLLEVAAEEVAMMLLGVHPRLEQVALRVQKPKALDGLALAASLRVQRTRADLADAEFSTETAPVSSGVHILPLFSTREADLSVATIDPHQRWHGSHDPMRRCLTWVLDGALSAEAHQLGIGQFHVCEPTRHISWTNRTTQVVRVFRCEARSEASLTAG